MKETERLWRVRVDAFIEDERLPFEAEQRAQLAKALYACVPDPVGMSPFLKRQLEARRNHLQSAVRIEWQQEARRHLKRVTAPRDGTPFVHEVKEPKRIAPPPARSRTPRAGRLVDDVDSDDDEALLDVDSAIAFGEDEVVLLEDD